MAKTKKKIVRREWTKEDVRQMKSMAKARSGVQRISKALKRTPGATQVMAGKLGAGLGCGQSDQEVGRGVANTHETVKSITEW